MNASRSGASGRPAKTEGPVLDAETQRRALEDGYRLVREIGSGAVSTVYEAEQLEAGSSRPRRRVALKVLRPTIAPSSSFAEPMVREARLLEDLGHPNVVRMLAVARSGERLSLALELVPGENLAQRMRQESRLPVARALAIALSVARGLAYLHERGLVHRDVKPQNVLLSTDGSVKLADLGIAELIPGSPLAKLEAEATAVGATGQGGQGGQGGRAARTVRREGVSFGTPAYMAPEALLAEGVAPVDPRTDLFSLGVVLYEMLSGTRPFDADPSSPDSTVITGPRSRARGRRERAEPLGRRAPQTPRAVERIVMRLVERRPEDRFASADLLVRALDRAAGDLGRVELSFGRNLARWQRQALAAGTVLALVALGTGLTRWRHRASAGGVVSAAGALRITAHPWAEIWVDGAKLETTPLARPLPLSAGEHEVVLKNPYFADEHRPLVVTGGAISTLDVVMSTPLDRATSNTASSDAAARPSEP